MTKTILFLTKIFSYKALGRTAKFEKFFRYLTDKNYHIFAITPNEPGLEQYKKFLGSNNRKIHLISVSFPSYGLRKFFLTRSDIVNNKTINFMINRTKRDIFNEIIYKTLKLLKSRIFIFPDNYADWIPFAFFKAYKLIKQKKISLLITACYPYSAHLVGLILKRITNIKWIAEFRDPWSNSPFEKRLKYVQQLSNLFERLVVANADYIVFYKGWFLGGKTYFLEKYSNYLKKIKELPYVGFDPNDFDEYIQNKNKKFTIIYIGNFYGEDYSPTNFLKALSNCIKKKLIPKEEIKILFYGSLDREYLILASKLGLKDIVEYKGKLPYRKLIPILKRCHMGLWIMGRKMQYKDNIPSKVFDYIGAQLPILALLPKESYSANFIEKFNLGVVAETSSVEDIKTALTFVFNQYKRGKLIFPKENISFFNMQKMFDEYYKLITSLI